MRVELTNGGWCELGNPTQVTERQRRPIRMAMARFSPQARSAMADGNPDDGDYTPGDLEVMYDINDLVAVALVKAASFLAPGAVCTADDVANLPGADYDRLTAALAPMIGSLMGGVDFDPTPDRDSPTPPSNA